MAPLEQAARLLSASLTSSPFGAMLPLAGRLPHMEQQIRFCSTLGREHSLGYYLRVANEVDSPRIFEALSLVKQSARQGRIRENRGALFLLY